MDVCQYVDVVVCVKGEGEDCENRCSLSGHAEEKKGEEEDSSVSQGNGRREISLYHRKFSTR